MNKQVAHILKDALGAIPGIDKMAGMVQTVEFQDTIYDESGTIPTTTIKKVPISCDVDVAACQQNDLIPDSSKKGMLYFEDGGITPLGKVGEYYKWRSKLRMVVWLNAKFINGNACYEITPLMLTHIVNKLDSLNATNQGNFLKLQIGIDNIPKQGKALFSEYTYDLYNTQYLMAPYEFFGIDLSVEYQMHPNCFAQLQLVQNPDLC